MEQPTSFTHQKTWAVKAKDFVGAVYDLGFVIDATQEGAHAKGRIIHPLAYVVPADADTEAQAIDQFVEAVNHDTHLRLQARGSK